MQTVEKKSYEKPVLEVYGSMVDVTLCECWDGSCGTWGSQPPTSYNPPKFQKPSKHDWEHFWGWKPWRF